MKYVKGYKLETIDQTIKNIDDEHLLDLRKHIKCYNITLSSDILLFACDQELENRAAYADYIQQPIHFVA